MTACVCRCAVLAHAEESWTEVFRFPVDLSSSPQREISEGQKLCFLMSKEVI